MPIIVEKYRNPVTWRGYDWVAYDPNISCVYGYGNTPEAARSDYNRQAETAIVDLTNHAIRAGYLAQAISSFKVRLAAARSQDACWIRELWMDRLDRDMADTLHLVDEADAIIRIRIDARRGVLPLRDRR